ncbi:hypothetical protein K450DRAFT_238656 [Umbelopsis ramanniana AG]|uniref:Uncharacterized protein n=1 Tax=Umbelopsis ramanniana AG TaxID=1314678 RepID=A0AAD5EBI0_UMBRA|nr:uncharacterized protein K450DRAFT_238656 [Umbelopsis ramanniana AG]KAI8580204.1 hypothetical protein K450DRAFT_238656 [Umbelopsis ramanniana AG]
MCQCEESKPRRGKNLPKGYLDSRAKKLDRSDKEDYEFTIMWLRDNAHACYHDGSGDVPEAHLLAEVALCKAHSSTLYRAKKKHLVDIKDEAPPSPTDSTSVETPPPGSLTYEQVEQPHQFTQGVIHASMPPNDPYYSRKSLQNPVFREGGLADRVRRMAPQNYTAEPLPAPSIKPTASVSLKRKRAKQSVADDEPYPRKTTSTPLKHGAQKAAPRNNTVRFVDPPTSMASDSIRQPHLSHSNTQLPPLKPRRGAHNHTSSLSSLSAIMQQQLHLQPTSISHAGNTPYGGSSYSYQQHPGACIVETVTLKSLPQFSHDPRRNNPTYLVRNLAISDTFTFRDILEEIEMNAPPPPGKRIIISDSSNEIVFPMDLPIRSVIRDPVEPHVELCLGLADVPSVDWNN